MPYAQKMPSEVWREHDPWLGAGRELGLTDSDGMRAFPGCFSGSSLDSGSGCSSHAAGLWSPQSCRESRAIDFFI